MNSDRINKWLTLGANLGVLIGLVIVIVELRQTQTNMLVESSMLRAQMSRENASLAARNNINQINEKLRKGEELTPDEIVKAEEFSDNLLRHFEVMHYQNEMGAMDEEIWRANEAGIRSFTNGPIFKYLYPNWPTSAIANRLRESFVQYTLSSNL